MSEFVVVDASLALKWLVEEENSDKATALTRLWSEQGTQLAPPPLLPFEVANALHRRVLRDELTVGVAASLMRDLMSLGVAFHTTPTFIAGHWNMQATSSREQLMTRSRPVKWCKSASS